MYYSGLIKMIACQSYQLNNFRGIGLCVILSILPSLSFFRSFVQFLSFNLSFVLSFSFFLSFSTLLLYFHLDVSFGAILLHRVQTLMFFCQIIQSARSPFLLHNLYFISQYIKTKHFVIKYFHFKTKNCVRTYFMFGLITSSGVMNLFL